MEDSRYTMYSTYHEIMRIGEITTTVDEIEPFVFEKGKSYLFVGCGSSYNIGLIVAEILNREGYYAKAVTAGSIAVNPKILDILSYDVVILISRTGTTTETVTAAKMLSGKVTTMGISCEKKAPLTDVCDVSFNLDFMRENSVVMTGSFSGIIRLLLNGINNVWEMNKKSRDVIRAEDFLESYMEMLEGFDFAGKDHFVFLGYGPSYYVAKESALKLQELSLARTEYNETLEYRHGPISTLSNKTHVTIFSTGSNLENDLANELLKKGASTHVLSCNSLYPYVDVQFQSLYAQLLGFYRAMKMGLNPDEPIGLKKSVIIEDVED
ncbi:MAG TPA: SIS domain-containing protein [Fervidobacterium sp.]|nr:sugar isomerase [Fervidobacterium sp.]HOQ40098.1 SIS domain-containing protein [Fervidobacterium sp.]HPT54524.1 SIS domain-containing protein [Fervidobacterium sp.]HQE49567.1 SIS domain-containing protein [Fervidobacterium sp.]HRD20671.1 SIS domain-containing protein [Fervidobacterium sp.]